MVASESHDRPPRPAQLVVDVQAEDGNRRYSCGDSRDTDSCCDLSSLPTPSEELFSEGSTGDCFSPTATDDAFADADGRTACSSIGAATGSSLGTSRAGWQGSGASTPHDSSRAPPWLSTANAEPQHPPPQQQQHCSGQEPLHDPEPTARHTALSIQVDNEDGRSSPGLRSPLSDVSNAGDAPEGDPPREERSFAFVNLAENHKGLRSSPPARKGGAAQYQVPDKKAAKWHNPDGTSIGEIEVTVDADPEALRDYRSPSPSSMVPELAATHSPATNVNGGPFAAADNPAADAKRGPQGRAGAFVSRSTMDTKFIMGRGGKLATSMPTVMDREAVSAPLPINPQMADRIQSLGEKLPGTQKVMLWVGIVLDIASKLSLVRELRRFALEQPLWMGMVLLFLLVTSIILTNYWLGHYPLDAALPERSNQAAPRVYGFTKNDVRLLVRRTGAVFAFLQLGTVFAAWRSLKSREEKQRAVAMDLRGMRLVDGLFLTMGLAILQTYIGITCRREACPGREGFDFFLAFSIVSSLFSGALAFLSLDYNDLKAKRDTKHTWESRAFFLFRLCELSCRAVLLALFAAAFKAKVFIVLFVHAVVVLLAIRFFPACKGVWEKASATKRWTVPLLCKGSISMPVPEGNDMQLLVACLVWPPSCFVSDSTDREGRFWWRGDLRVGRRSFWSLNTQDGILSFPLFQGIMAAEAAVMITIMYYVAEDWTHMYLSACMGLFVLWCFFGMVWSSTIYSNAAQRLAVLEAAPTGPNSMRRRNAAADPSATGGGRARAGAGTPPRGAAAAAAGDAADPEALDVDAAAGDSATCGKEGSSDERGYKTVPAGFTMDPEVLKAFSDRAPAAPPAETTLQRLRRIANRNKKGKENSDSPGNPSPPGTRSQAGPSATGGAARKRTAAGPHHSPAAATPTATPSPSSRFAAPVLKPGRTASRAVTPPAPGPIAYRSPEPSPTSAARGTSAPPPGREPMSKPPSPRPVDVKFINNKGPVGSVRKGHNIWNK